MTESKSSGKSKGSSTDPTAPQSDEPKTSDEQTGDTHVLEEALDKGYLGETADERPNEEYTVEGVSKAPDVTDEAYVEHKEAEQTGKPEGES